MNFLIENWFIGVAILALLVVAGFFINLFLKMPREKQLDKVREWLVYACVLAEQEFQSGNGALKLRYVFNNFVQAFPWMAKVVTFELFSMMVDEALVKVRLMLETNKDVKRIVDEGKKEA